MKEFNIDKEAFVNALGSVKAQIAHDDRCGDAFSVILPDGYGRYDNSLLVNGMLALLKTACFDDHSDSWIDYFVWELDFGIKWKPASVTYEDGSSIDISTAGKLYEFLQANVKDRQTCPVERECGCTDKPEWRYNFPSVPSKRICAKCFKRQALDAKALTWTRTFRDSRTDLQLINAWHKL